jgi:hypothetical protein
VKASLVMQQAQQSSPNQGTCFNPELNTATYTNHEGVTLVYDNDDKSLGNVFNLPVCEGHEKVQKMLENGETCAVTDADKTPKQDESATRDAKVECNVEPLTPPGS